MLTIFRPVVVAENMIGVAMYELVGLQTLADELHAAYNRTGPGRS